MRIITEPTIRQVISSHLRDQRKNTMANASIRKLKDLDSYAGAINSAQSEAMTELQKRFRLEIELCRLFVLSIGVSAFELTGFAGRFPPVLPKNWIAKKGVPDVNLLFECMLVQLANYSLSVIKLSECGLEGPARSLLRSVIEASSQIIVLFGDRDLLRNYNAYVQSYGTSKAWHKFFSRGKLFENLMKIEKSIGLSDRTVERLCKDREELFKIYSEAVHSSASAGVAHTYVQVFGEKKLRYALWGRASKSIKTILDTLNRALFHHTLIYMNLLKRLGFLENTSPALEISRCALIAHQKCYT